MIEQSIISRAVVFIVFDFSWSYSTMK